MYTQYRTYSNISSNNNTNILRKLKYIIHGSQTFNIKFKPAYCHDSVQWRNHQRSSKQGFYLLNEVNITAILPYRYKIVSLLWKQLHNPFNTNTTHIWRTKVSNVSVVGCWIGTCVSIMICVTLLYNPYEHSEKLTQAHCDL